jgi:hypothetical protein
MCVGGSLAAKCRRHQRMGGVESPAHLIQGRRNNLAVSPRVPRASVACAGSSCALSCRPRPGRSLAVCAEQCAAALDGTNGPLKLHRCVCAHHGARLLPSSVAGAPILRPPLPPRLAGSTLPASRARRPPALASPACARGPPRARPWIRGERPTGALAGRPRRRRATLRWSGARR